MVFCFCYSGKLLYFLPAYRLLSEITEMPTEPMLATWAGERRFFNFLLTDRGFCGMNKWCSVLCTDLFEDWEGIRKIRKEN